MKDPLGNELPTVAELRERIANRPPTQLDRIEAKIDTLLAKKKIRPRASKVECPEWILIEFGKFWKAWPNKKAKVDALAAFTALIKKTGIFYGAAKCYKLIEDIKHRLKSDYMWIKDEGAYIPLAATYLRGYRWNDDITPIPKKKHSEDPDKQHHATYDPDAKVVIPVGVNPYEMDM